MKKNVKLALVIPQKCTFLANKLLKAWEMLNFQLVILKKNNFSVRDRKERKKIFSCLPGVGKRTNRDPCLLQMNIFLMISNS